MISDETKKKIMERAEEHMYITDWDDFEKQFNECYVITENGEKMIVATNTPSQICTKYHLRTGEMVGLEDKGYAKKHGRLL